MKKFKKVLVGLDLTAMDEILIQETVKIVQVLEIEKVYFVHVAKDLTLPEDITNEYPDLTAPLDESIERNITKAITEAGFPKDIKFEVEAKEGNPLEKILRWVKVKDVDLLIMGRKTYLKGGGSLAKRLAGKSPCSVLFFTETGPKTLKKIMVPVDFSSYSHLALAFAQEFVKDTSSIKCIHLYELPAGYTKTGKTHAEFAEIMLENAKKHYQKFLLNHQLPSFDCEFILKNDNSISKIILEHASKEDMDLIIIGSRGKGESLATLLGTVAEHLVEVNNQIPMMILKKKGETIGFLEALFRI